jgi:hypothetical protein
LSTKETCYKSRRNLARVAFSFVLKRDLNR